MEHVAEKIRCRQEQLQRVKKDERVNDPLDDAPRAHVSEAVMARAAMSTPVETIELASKGLVNMGFAKVDVRRALDVVCARHQGEVLRVEAILREAIAALT